MDCGVIDECRCYTFKGVGNPRKNQFCGARRGVNVAPCPSACCAGGCPGQTPGTPPRQPFRILKRPSSSRKKSVFFNRDYMFGFFTIITLFFLVFYDLKINAVKKI